MNRFRDLQVGLFVLAGLVLSGAAIFLIGDERRLFNSSVEFHTKFSDVQGLKSGAPVQMGGLDIGHVASVGYGADPRDTTIYVAIRIVRSESSRIKQDSLARIATKGLLGDKMVEITKGKSAQVIPPGGDITSEEPSDMLGRVSGIAQKAESAMANVERLSGSLADERLQRDLRETVASMNVVLRDVASGDGYPHRFLTDKDEADHISRTLANLDRATAELNTTLVDVRSVVDRVKQGPGFAHEVIYGEGLARQVGEISGAAVEVTETLKGIRQSDSFVHDALYGGKGDGATALANVNAATADLRAIMAGVKAGKGTVGALLVDPSVYDDLKAVLGNVERNDVLRALVRYSIKQDEKRPAVQVGATPPP